MYDIIVVGSGPAGLSAAIYGIRAGRKVLVIEKEYEGAGQIALSSQVDNYLGYYGVDGYTISEHFLDHAKHFGVQIKNATVLSIEKKEDRYEVNVKARKNEEIIEASNVIYCAGARHRNLDVEGEMTLQGKGVSYCATCDGGFYKHKSVAVVGGGDTALDDAMYLSEIAKQVIIIHRREQFRGSFSTLQKLKQKENVTIITGVNIKSIIGENKVEKLILDNDEEIYVDGVFIAVGMSPQTELIKKLVKCDEDGYVIAGEDGRTDLKGFYVAGDVRTKALRQVITAVSDGANAVHSIIQDM